MKISLKQALMIALGVLMIGIGIHFFLLPANLSLGGATGMVLVLGEFLPLDIGALLIIVNVVLFILGFLIIGPSFGMLTVISALSLSGLVWLLEKVFPITEPFLEDRFLSLVIAVLVYGTGVGIVLNQSASTGGSDILAKIMNKFTGWNIGRCCLIADFCITLASGFTFGVETFLYCILGVVLNGIMIDMTIDGLNAGKLCQIHSNHPEAIVEYLISCGRSATLYTAKGGYSGQERTVVETVVSQRDFIRMRRKLLEIDQQLFMIVSNAHHVFGFNWKALDD